MNQEKRIQPQRHRGTEALLLFGANFPKTVLEKLIKKIPLFKAPAANIAASVPLCLCGCIFVLVSLALAAESTTQPAPATQPTLGTIQGTVSITGDLALQKPDLSRVVVFLGDDPALKSASAPLKPAYVAQHNKAFHPNFLIVQRNTTIEFPNWDHYDHNVFSRSAAAPAFDLDRYPYGQSKSRVFTKLGVVQLFCNIHPQMRAVIYVTPNSFFTRCSADGHFQLTNVPAGKFTIFAWQERCGEQSKALEVTTDKPSEIAFTLGEKHDHVIAADDPDRHAAYGVERGLGVKRDILNLPVVKDSHPAPPDSQPQ